MKRPSHILRGMGMLALGMLYSTALFAQSGEAWTPTRPLRIIAPGPPGAILDLAARQIAEKLAGPLGQPVIVDNKPSAGGTLAMEVLAGSPADGHTVAIASFVELTVNPSLYDNIRYDPVRDFAPVTLLYAGTLLLVAHPALKVDTLPDLIKAGKARPGSLFYGSSGIARPPHIYAERFKTDSGIGLVHVPYKGTPPLVQAILNGEIHLAIEGAPPLLPHVKAGKLMPLAVTGETRLPSLPDVPTFSEMGVTGMTAAWVGIVAPAGTPQKAIERLNREFAEALRSPDVKAAYEAGGRQVITGSPEAMAELIRSGIPQWQSVVKASGLKAQ
ncbi:Bug family tripartite tricarboxylate transporter substrate binding protein [Noviherbaspirillum sp.]|uniref:Bug family tripartite tricarboxylate transporter substrate binding protein n=1 Tax=Noviherbaspirillum sp. TaxID=1926288 RepID=UPI002FE40629